MKITGVKKQGTNDVLKNSDNDFEVLLAKIMSLIIKSSAASKNQPKSVIDKMEPPEFITELLANIVINLCAQAIKEESSGEDKMNTMHAFCQRLFTMVMMGYESVVERQGAH